MVLPDIFASEFAPFFIKQGIRLIQKSVSKAEISDIVEKTEQMLGIIKNKKNILYQYSSLSEEDVDQVYEHLEELIYLGKKFLRSSYWSFCKNLELNRKIGKIEKNLEHFLRGPLLVSLLVSLCKIAEFLENSSKSSTPQLQTFNYQAPQLDMQSNYEHPQFGIQLNYEHLQLGERPYFLIKTNFGDHKISRQYLGASEIWFSALFEGTVVEPVKIASYDGVLGPYTFLRVSITQSNTGYILLHLRDNIGNLNMNDRVAVFGQLGTSVGVNGNGNHQLVHKVTVTRTDSTCKQIQSNIGPYLWVENADGRMQCLNKWNIGASEIFISASFQGIVTQPVNYAMTSIGIWSAWTFLCVSIPGGSRLIRLEARNEEIKSCIRDLNINHHVSVSGFLLPYIDVDQNGNSQIFYKVIAEQLIRYN